ncbi:hypothetical protein Landi51_09238 [Colletotrichum acutatum]
MKFSVLILPVLASGITALYVPDKLVQAFLKDSSEGNCCNETPCFIGCPVEGVFRPANTNWGPGGSLYGVLLWKFKLGRPNTPG